MLSCDLWKAFRSINWKRSYEKYFFHHHNSSNFAKPMLCLVFQTNFVFKQKNFWKTEFSGFLRFELKWKQIFYCAKPLRPALLSQKCGFYFFPDFNLENKKLAILLDNYAWDRYFECFSTWLSAFYFLTLPSLYRFQAFGKWNFPRFQSKDLTQKTTFFVREKITNSY